MPLLVAVQSSGDFETSFWLYLGSLLWIIGFYFEAVGDRQLTKFLMKKSSSKKKKSKQFLTSGLWAYTRHPNYFGEVTQWWGLFVMTIGLANFWWGVIGPLTITFLLLMLSGIPMLEKKYAGNKEFEKYRKTTNAFFPGPRRRKNR
jgi:steroid 5-alpha reductase family enzyme